MEAIFPDSISDLTRATLASFSAEIQLQSLADDDFDVENANETILEFLKETEQNDRKVTVRSDDSNVASSAARKVSIVVHFPNI